MARAAGEPPKKTVGADDNVEGAPNEDADGVGIIVLPVNDGEEILNAAAASARRSEADRERSEL